MILVLGIYSINILSCMENYRFFFVVVVYFFLATLGLRCCFGFALVVANGNHPLLVVRGLLVAVASLVSGHRL